LCNLLYFIYWATILRLFAIATAFLHFCSGLRKEDK